MNRIIGLSKSRQTLLLGRFQSQITLVLGTHHQSLPSPNRDRRFALRVGGRRIPSLSPSHLHWMRLTHRYTPTASLRMSLDRDPLRPQTQPLSLASTIHHHTLGTTTIGVDPVMVIQETPPTMSPLDQRSTVAVVLPPLPPKVVTPRRLPQSHRPQLPPTIPRPMLPPPLTEVMLPRLLAPTPPRRPAPTKSLRLRQLPPSHHRKSVLQRLA